MFNVENSSHIFVIGLYYLLLKDSSLIFVMMPQFSGGDKTRQRPSQEDLPGGDKQQDGGALQLHEDKHEEDALVV